MPAPTAVPTPGIKDPNAAPVTTAAPRPIVSAVGLSAPSSAAPALARCPAPAPTTPTPAATGNAVAVVISGAAKEAVAV